MGGGRIGVGERQKGGAMLNLHVAATGCADAEATQGSASVSISMCNRRRVSGISFC